MTQQNTKKTYVGGSFLYSHDGLGYEEGYKQQKQAQQKVIQDKIGIQQYQKQLRERKIQAINKKKSAQVNKIVEKPVLIPIRDTPVQPVPQPVLENQKCERATQEQFEYFQTYISQKQKQRKFEEEEERQLSMFEENQRRKKQRQLEENRDQMTVVMEKEGENVKKVKGKKIIKKIIKKKQQKSQKEE